MSHTPGDSPERLAALERSGLLDSPPEAAFDPLVELARDLLGGTVALRLLHSFQAAESEREQFLRQVRASEAQLRLVMDALPVQVSGEAAYAVLGPYVR